MTRFNYVDEKGVIHVRHSSILDRDDDPLLLCEGDALVKGIEFLYGLRKTLNEVTCLMCKVIQSRIE